MKKFFILMISILLILNMVLPVYAADDVKIKVDGKELIDAQAILQNGSTLLPVRSVSDALGGAVVWDAETKSVTIIKGLGIVVTLTIGEKTIYKNGKNFEISVPAQIINGKTYVPLRVLGDALECGIEWVKETKTVEITQSKETVSTRDNHTVPNNRDLFGDSEKNIPYFISNGVYLTEGEVVPIPVIGGNWVEWSDRTIIDCEWGFYNNQEVIFITGLKKGTSALKVYESTSQKGLITGEYTEIKVHVVNDSSAKYKEQRVERIASGFDILANQEDLMEAEEYVKNKYELELEGVWDTTYTGQNNVLVIPINSNSELTGTFYLTAEKNADLQAVMDTYGGKPAIFIKGTKLTSTKVLLRYINNTDGLEFEFIEEDYKPSLLWDRDSARKDIGLNNIETAAWEFNILVTAESNSRLKEQEKERLAKGISYELYLSGQA